MNTQTVLAIQVLRELARAGEPQTIEQLAVRLDLQASYTTKLLGMLRRAGFVASTRGKTGGHTLARPADQILVVEVFGALEGGILPDRPGDTDSLRALQQHLRETILGAWQCLTVAAL